MFGSSTIVCPMFRSGGRPAGRSSGNTSAYLAKSASIFAFGIKPVASGRSGLDSGCSVRGVPRPFNISFSRADLSSIGRLLAGVKVSPSLSSSSLACTPSSIGCNGARLCLQPLSGVHRTYDLYRDPRLLPPLAIFAAPVRLPLDAAPRAGSVSSLDSVAIG